MANPNPNVWGSPESWAYINKGLPFVGNGTVSRRTSKPKMATWNGGASLLYDGYLAGKTPIGEMLDLTISPCGQLPSVSMFGKIALFRNEKSATQNIIPRYTIEQSTPVNWFFAGVNRPSTVYTFNHEKNYSDSDYRWKPNTTCSTNNSNAWISILTYWQIKSLLLAIEVATIESYDSNGVPVVSWRTLDEWKTSHNTKKICDIRCWVCGVTSENDNHIQYYTHPVNPNFNYFIVSPLITTKNAWDGQEIIDYTTYNARSVDCAFYIIGALLYGNGYDTTRTYSMSCYDMFDNQTYHSHSNATDTEHGWTLWSEIPYSDATYNKILSVVSTFGCAFTPSNKRDFPTIFTDNDLYIPVIDNDGIARGEYTHGADNSDNPFFYKTSLRDIDYDPSAQVDPNTYSLTTHFNTVGSVASTTKQYVINGDGLRGLSGEMWTIMSDLVVNPEDVGNLSNLSLDAFLTNNPIDAIVSVKKFPLDHVPHGETLENVYLGKYRTSAGAYELAAQQAQYNFSAIPVYPKFGGCFLDYSPYTTMQLYIPFCGTIEIDPADFMGRNLSVEMNMDFITGTVTAYVLSNELVIQTATGQCAIDVPITGTESATVDAAYQSAVINERQARNKYYQAGLGVLKHPIKSFLSPVSTTLKTISSAQSWAQTEYELTHIQEPLRQIGAASPLNSWALEFVCRLIIYYPDGEIITFNANNEPALIEDKVKAFGDVNGFATVETGLLSNFEGFTQVSSVDLDNVKATQNELEMIRNLLQGGVYL